MKKVIIPLALLAFFCIIIVTVICLPITKVKAQHIAETVVVNNPKSQIEDYNHPTIEKVKIPQGTEYQVSNGDAGLTDIQGKRVWKITYHTGLDGMLGPIVVYIDYYKGTIYGFDIRF